jgi:hypothetical protein
MAIVDCHVKSKELAMPHNNVHAHRPLRRLSVESSSLSAAGDRQRWAARIVGLDVFLRLSLDFKVELAYSR